MYEARSKPVAVKRNYKNKETARPIPIRVTLRAYPNNPRGGTTQLRRKNRTPRTVGCQYAWAGLVEWPRSAAATAARARRADFIRRARSPGGRGE